MVATSHVLCAFCVLHGPNQRMQDKKLPQPEIMEGLFSL